MHSLRSFARSFEPHPFQRLPVASSPAPADWGKLVKRSVKQFAVYVSLFFFPFPSSVPSSLAP